MSPTGRENGALCSGLPAATGPAGTKARPGRRLASGGQAVNREEVVAGGGLHEG